MATSYLSDDEIARLKWIGINVVQLDAFEVRQRQRIQALEEQLARERQELASIIAARSGDNYRHQEEFGSQYAPPRYSTRLTWKDKIILVIKESGRPMLGREIGPVLKRWEPQGLKYTHLDNTVSVHLTKLVRDGALVRTRRKGQSGALYGLPE
jgi:hypothetical protein